MRQYFLLFLKKVTPKLPFKQGVRGSNPRRGTKKVQESQGFPDFLFLPRLTLLVRC